MLHLVGSEPTASPPAHRTPDELVGELLATLAHRDDALWGLVWRGRPIQPIELQRLLEGHQ